MYMMLILYKNAPLLLLSLNVFIVYKGKFHELRGTVNKVDFRTIECDMISYSDFHFFESLLHNIIE